MEALNIGCGNKHWSQSDIDLIDWLHNKPGRYGAGCSGLIKELQFIFKMYIASYVFTNYY